MANTPTSPLFPTNTLGILSERTSGTPDGIFLQQDPLGNLWNRTFTAGKKKYYASWMNLSGSAADKTTLFNLAMLDSRIEVLVIDEPVTLNGAVNFQGKIVDWDKGGLIQGTGTGSNMVISAPYTMKISEITFTLDDPDSVTGVASLMWGGAGNDIADSQPAAQWVADFVAKGTYIHKLFIPQGIYNFPTIGLLIRNPNPSTDVSEFFQSLHVYGPANAIGGSAGQVFWKFGANTFGIGIQRGKSCTFQNIGFQGNSLHLLSWNLQQVIESTREQWAGTSRDNRFSPHAAFVVDPISTNALAAENRYPGFEDLYVAGEGGGGSSDIQVINCSSLGTVVSFCVAPHNQPQNAESITFRNCWAQYTLSAFTLGQAQSRTCRVENCNIWSVVETAFDSERFGDGTADHYTVTDVNIAGGVKYLTRLSSFISKGMLIKSGHIEQLWSFGGNFVLATAGKLSIESMFIDMLQNIYNGPSDIEEKADVLFTGDTLNITDTTLLRYSGSDPSPFIINSNFLNIRGGSVTPILCQGTITSYIGAVNGVFPEGIFSVGSTVDRSPQQSPQYPLYGGGKQYYSPIYNSTYMQGVEREKLSSNIRRLNYSASPSWSEGINIVTVYNITVAALDPVAFTFTYALSSSTTNYKITRVGDYLYGNSKIIGTITAKNAGTITVGYIGSGLTNTDVVGVSVFRYQTLLRQFAIGDATSGSATISNVVVENFVSQFPLGTEIQSPYFPKGTYIVSFNGTNTLVVSAEATASATGIDIISEDWKATWRGTIQEISSAYRLPFKQGDEIINTDPINYPSIEKWLITKSGISSVVTPEYAEIEWPPAP